MDETWIHPYTAESNQQSAEWGEAGKSHPRRSKSQTSAGKIMASVFWDTHAFEGRNHSKMTSNGTQMVTKGKEMVSETDAYFEDNDKSLYVKKLEKRWNDWIVLKGGYVEK